jgi:protoporphyrin/coproporphyrin ferrochelatase
MADRPAGVLLVNLGTPAAPEPRAVRRYLREFLGDPRVLDMAAPLRWLLLHAVILPLRPRRSAAAYAKIWSEEGSPLLAHGRALRAALAGALGPGFRVELAMRYGEPGVAGALARLEAADAEPLVVAPLFPQYSLSSTGSALEHVYAQLARGAHVPAVRALGPFWDDPGVVAAWAAVARAPLAAFRPDRVLLSFHGLPERHVRATDPSGAHCLASATCCDALGPANRHCYRAQCFATARAIAGALGLAPSQWGVGFQSRLGRTPWIHPYTDVLLPEWAAEGVRRVAVMCPSFVADCLETVEEIGIRARAQWQALGGEELLLVPCLNAHPAWVEALAALVRRAAGQEATPQSASAQRGAAERSRTS